MFKKNLLPSSRYFEDGGNGFNFQKTVILIVSMVRTAYFTDEER
jgi:hypothetical protein